MSDCKIKPEPGQVWRYDGQPNDYVIGSVRDRLCGVYYRDGAWHEWWDEVRGNNPRFLRWATPAERKAAGLLPERIGCSPTMAGLGTVLAEQNLRQADASMAEERIATLTKERDAASESAKRNAAEAFKQRQDAQRAFMERDAAQRECAVYRREFNVGDLRFKLKQAEKERDEARNARDSAMGMYHSAVRERDSAIKRAEAADADVARLRAAPIVEGQFSARFPPKHGDTFWWMGRCFVIQDADTAIGQHRKPTQLTPEDRAWMDALQNGTSEWGICGKEAKAAIAARKGGA